VSGATAFALSTLFILVYGLTGWITSLRTDVGMWAFDWEQRLPFVPWLIVPYMSLDLFFVAAPFLCSSRMELRVFTRRMSTAILAAGALFLVMPLRFAFPRPAPAGWTAEIFELLYGFDRPCNLFPSLHIAILIILSATYHRHTRGTSRWLIHGWFTLIGMSTVLTYQHHVIDMVGGLALGIVCCYLVADRSTRQPITPNARIGVWYAVGAAIVASAGIWERPWGLALLWPAASATIVAGAYFGLCGHITRKEDGRLPLAARIVLGPWLAGQQVSLVYYQRQAAAWNAVAADVWIGRQLNDREAAGAVREGVTAVLDLTAEFSEAGPLLALPYLNLPVLDLTGPTPQQVRAAIEFINAYRREGVVYIHCKIGYSRSAAIVGSWLIDSGLAVTPDEAVSRIRAARPSVVVRPEAFAALQAFHRGDADVSRRTSSLIEVRA
jgi:membrane-associated phospholipid phosphatase